MFIIMMLTDDVNDDDDDYMLLRKGKCASVGHWVFGDQPAKSCHLCSVIIIFVIVKEIIIIAIN